MNEHSNVCSTEPPDTNPRKAKVGPPLSWISESFRMIRAHWTVIVPAYLVVLGILALCQYGLVMLIPDKGVVETSLIIAGGVLIALLLNAGILSVFHGIAERRPRFADIFSGFSVHTILHFVLMFVMMALAAAILGFVGYMVTDFSVLSGSAFGAAGFGSLVNGSSVSQGSVMAFLFMSIAGLSLVAVFAALFSYAVPLISLSRHGIIDAMDDSFRASFKNIFVLVFFGVNAFFFMQLVLFPMLLVGVAGSAPFISFLILVASFTWGLILIGAYYLSFRDILLAETRQYSNEAEESAFSA